MAIKFIEQYEEYDEVRIDWSYYSITSNKLPEYEIRKYIREDRTVYFKNNIVHRDDDLPAEIFKESEDYKVLYYYKNGKIHRDDNKPAIIHIKLINNNWEDYKLEYYQYGKYIDNIYLLDWFIGIDKNNKITSSYRKKDLGLIN